MTARSFDEREFLVQALDDGVAIWVPRDDRMLSLRARLLAMVVMATLVPAALMAMGSFQNRTNEIARAAIQMSRAVSDISNDLDGKILGTTQLLFGLARARNLDSREPGQCARFLSAVRTEYTRYTDLFTIETDGSLSCDSLQSGKNLNLVDRSYFKRAIAATDVVTLEPVFGRLTGIAVLQIAYPVRSETGNLRFILTASLDLQAFAEYHKKRLPKAMAIVIVDESGNVLVHSSGGSWYMPAKPTIADTNLVEFAITHRNAAAGEVVGADGRTQVWSVASLPAPRTSGLLFLVGESKDDLVAIANQNLARDLTILAAVSLLLFAGIWTLAERGISRQINRVSTMATKLTLGDLTARIPPPYPSGELGGLMMLLNGTAKSLEHQRTSIDDLRNKLHQAQKMEALGQLTGGIAHDFNNLLTVISGNSELLVEQLHDNEPLRMMAEMSLSASRRAAEHTKGLLAFARRQPLEPMVVDVNLLVSRMQPLLRGMLGQNIAITFVKGMNLWHSLVDPSQLEAAILNLCINARDAMEDGGRLSIETANKKFDKDAAAVADLNPGEYVMIIVSDTGSGISREYLDRVFEPFFTTKDVSKGTGLGLSMVYGFVKQSGGQAKIYSEVGQGTAIKMFLPKTSDAIDDVVDEEDVLLADLYGSEKILLVEDDALVRRHVEQQFIALGYLVTTAENGPAALAIIMRDRDIDLLFTDIVMPGGMNGRMLALRSADVRPDLKVLYTSGFTQGALLDEGCLEDNAILLNKPYSRIELARKLRTALSVRSDELVS
jgi:signal transduction histidine kinase